MFIIYFHWSFSKACNCMSASPKYMRFVTCFIEIVRPKLLHSVVGKYQFSGCRETLLKSGFRMHMKKQFNTLVPSSSDFLVAFRTAPL